MTARKVVLWRHGRTTHNHSGTWQGQLDTPLDDVGRAQAEQAAVVLAQVVERWRRAGRPVTVVSSDLSRARDTAAALERRTGLRVEQDKRLREIFAGSWEGLTRAQIAAAGMAADLEAWGRGEDVALGGGERRSEAAVRAATAVAEHAAAGDDGLLVVVSHGGVGRGATLSLLGLPPGDWDVLGGIANCHWVDLQPGAPRWRLHGFNVGADDAPIWSPTPAPG